MDENYKNAIEEYKKINFNIGNKIISLSLTVIGAIFVISEKYGVGRLFIISFLGFVLTIASNLANNICSSKHYERFLEKTIDKLYYGESNWGICAEYLYWIFIGFFIISISVFIVALILLIKNI